MLLLIALLLFLQWHMCFAPFPNILCIQLSNTLRCQLAEAKLMLLLMAALPGFFFGTCVVVEDI